MLVVESGLGVGVGVEPLTLVAAVATRDLFVVSVAVNVCVPAVLKVTENVAIPFLNVMLVGSVAAPSELVSLMLSENPWTMLPWELTAANSTVVATPVCAPCGVRSSNCEAAIDGAAPYSAGGIAPKPEGQPGTALNSERTSNGSNRS